MENISWKYLRMFLGILAFWGFMINCSRGGDTSDAPIIPETGRYKIRPFNPGYFKDENQKHLAIPLRIKGGKLEINREKVNNVKLRSGNLPYSPGGDTVVVYKDLDGTEIGRYSIEDPTKSRSCDLIDGKERLGVYQLNKADVELELELLLPSNPEIAFINIIYAGEDKKSLEMLDVKDIDVQGIVKAAIDKSKRDKRRVSDPKESSPTQ